MLSEYSHLHLQYLTLGSVLSQPSPVHIGTPYSHNRYIILSSTMPASPRRLSFGWVFLVQLLCTSYRCDVLHMPREFHHSWFKTSITLDQGHKLCSSSRTVSLLIHFKTTVIFKLPARTAIIQVRLFRCFYRATFASDRENILALSVSHAVAAGKQELRSTLSVNVLQFCHRLSLADTCSCSQ
jgi:hypothetical protein